MTGDTTDGSLVDLPTTAVGLQLELVTAGGSNCETPRMLAVEPRLGRRDWEATFCIVLYSMQHAKLVLRVKHTTVCKGAFLNYQLVVALHDGVIIMSH